MFYSRTPLSDAFGEIRQAIVFQALARVKEILTGKGPKQTQQKSRIARCSLTTDFINHLKYCEQIVISFTKLYHGERNG